MTRSPVNPARANAWAALTLAQLGSDPIVYQPLPTMEPTPT